MRQDREARLSFMVDKFPCGGVGGSRLGPLLRVYHEAELAGRWAFIKDEDSPGQWAAKLKSALRQCGWILESKRVHTIDPRKVDWYSVNGNSLNLITGEERRDIGKNVTAHRLEAGQMKAVIEYAREEMRADRLWYSLRRRGAMEGFGL